MIGTVSPIVSCIVNLYHDSVLFQLEEHITRLREELDREREERNYFQLERDKVNTFWEITKRQLEEKKAELRNKDREMEDAEERHQMEIKVNSNTRHIGNIRFHF